MIVITPLTKTLAEAQAILTSSTVAEPDASMGEVAWNAATNYALGQVVVRTTTHKKYENILAGIDAGLPENTPTRWLDRGPSNKYAMFDTLRNTKTRAPSPLSVTLTPNKRIDAIGVFGIEAETITITMMNGTEQVYSVTQNLNTRNVANWFGYFFEPFSNIPSLAKFDLPPYTGGVLTVTFASNTGMVACGALIVGNQTYVGAVQYSAVSEELNFSRIDRAFDGTALLTQRRSIPKVNAKIYAKKNNTNKIRALRTSLNAVPAVWSGLDDLNTDDYFEALLILGIYKQFVVDIAYLDYTLVNLEIEEI